MSVLYDQIIRYILSIPAIRRQEAGCKTGSQSITRLPFSLMANLELPASLICLCNVGDVEASRGNTRCVLPLQEPSPSYDL